MPSAGRMMDPGGGVDAQDTACGTTTEDNKTPEDTPSVETQQRLKGQQLSMHGRYP